jgi:hypothetical protein
MEWHGRVTATDDLSLFEEIENLRQATHLVSPDDVKTDDGGHTNESISDDTEELPVVRDHPLFPLVAVPITELLKTLRAEMIILPLHSVPLRGGDCTSQILKRV